MQEAQQQRILIDAAVASFHSIRRMEDDIEKRRVRLGALVAGITKENLAEYVKRTELK